MLEFVLLASALATLEIDEITVVARRRESVLDVPVAVSALSPATEPGFVHPNQLLNRVPGTWISRGSGQEHLTAIRSPVLTGAGACGAFLYLDDGIPIRPPGFCNVNNLFELNLGQAGQVEVLRGPAPALYGSNGLHGVINVRPRRPLAEDPSSASLWLGSDAHRSVRGAFSGASFGGAGRLDIVGTSSGSFRAQEGFDEQKLNWLWDGALGELAASFSLSASNLNQETAGFILGQDAYRDPVLRRENLNPEAFRDARSVRLGASVITTGGAWQHTIRPFARSSRMTFAQHFLPGKPLEDNGQDSAGLQWLARREGAASDLRLGLDVDYADGFLREFQTGPTQGSAFLVATRPSGLHYDFTVRSLTTAFYVELDQVLFEGWKLHLGLRAERSRYRYDNLALVGNTRDDGSICGFGGCLYARPADRNDAFVDVAPKLGLSWRSGANSLLFLRAGRGFRAPQVTELYRLQRSQSVADLDSEKVLNTELGWRWFGDRGALQLGAWYMNKRNFIFRDAQGFNVSDGRTRHRGFEWDVALHLGPDWRLAQAGSFGRHHYAFSRLAGGGEEIVTGNAVDTAPRWLARTALEFSRPQWGGSLQWVHQDEYYLDAANSAVYGGHNLLHLNVHAAVWRDWRLDLRLDNLANRRYAERADFAFGNLRYFPGAGRQLFAGISWRPRSLD